MFIAPPNEPLAPLDMPDPIVVLPPATGKTWGILHDGHVQGEHANKQAAYESAVSAGLAAVRQGHEVHISMPGNDSSADNAMGNRDHGPDI